MPPPSATNTRTCDSIERRDPYESFLFDPSFVLSLIALPDGTPLPLPILDDPILDGLEVNIQAAVQETSGALEMTNVYRPRFHR